MSPIVPAYAIKYTRFYLLFDVFAAIVPEGNAIEMICKGDLAIHRSFGSASENRFHEPSAHQFLAGIGPWTAGNQEVVSGLIMGLE